MNQAIKSALEKYNGKRSGAIANSSDEQKISLNSKIFTVILMCVVVVLGAMLCIKLNIFGAGDLWQRVTKKGWGETTENVLGEIKAEVSSVFGKEEVGVSAVSDNSSQRVGTVNL